MEKLYGRILVVTQTVWSPLFHPSSREELEETGDDDKESVGRHAMTKETGDAEPGEKRLEETQWRSCGFYRLSKIYETTKLISKQST